jgi:GNAT superfamily N-acetyltransferase
MPGPRYRLRPAGPADCPALAPLYRDFFSFHRRLLGNEQPLTPAEGAEAASEALGQPRSWLLVAQEEGTGALVGLVRWEEREGAFFGRELFVCPAHRGRGLGTRLLQAAEEQVRQAGADAFFVSVVPHNREMLAFAHRRGYDTLNTVELRRELAGRRPRRSRVTLFGLEFRVI